MTGVSTRFAFKILSETFNHDNEEVAADPVHLMYVLEQAIRREQFMNRSSFSCPRCQPRPRRIRRAG